MKSLYPYIIALFMMVSFSCKGNQSVTQEQGATDSVSLNGPVFVEDSAYSYCATQCAFGPRTMNSEAHDNCKEWIVGKFKSFGLDVIEQNAQLKGYDGTTLNSTNIIAQYKPELENRVLLCAHWDTRPWADNDPLEDNHHTAIDGANDGASGIGVMLELARLLQKDSLGYGVDFVCFDAEDWGTPKWAESNENDSDTWALGAQYWSKNPHKEGYSANFGILLDMVGVSGSKFYYEYFSKLHAPAIQQKIWKAAIDAGYGSSFFPQEDGGAVTDDHLPVIENAHIPCVDIIPYFPNCEQSSFGTTWHTVNDNMQNISKETLKAVGQTLVQTLYSE